MYSHNMVGTNDVEKAKQFYDATFQAIGGKPGIGAAALKSLNAGVDFILVSYSEKHLNAMMTALLAADAAGNIDDGVRAKSRTRIDKVLAPHSVAGSN